MDQGRLTCGSMSGRPPRYVCPYIYICVAPMVQWSALKRQRLLISSRVTISRSFTSNTVGLLPALRRNEVFSARPAGFSSINKEKPSRCQHYILLLYKQQSRLQATTIGP